MLGLKRQGEPLEDIRSGKVHVLETHDSPKAKRPLNDKDEELSRVQAKVERLRHEIQQLHASHDQDRCRIIGERINETKTLRQRHFFEIAQQHTAFDLLRKSDLKMEDEAHALHASILELELEQHKQSLSDLMTQLQKAVQDHVTQAYLDETIRRVELLLLSQQITVLEWIDIRLGCLEPQGQVSTEELHEGTTT
ncbi:hypothetical protein V5O48_018982 [Marasmius crinis-equi]|uniref:Uncharacterized protein n=1 Tax=Marasmius crinis-equi TaxID=585013 RepID=A0ABR3EJR7_9AGAR